MPTRKQRRRQQKGRRHEYEYVYVDDEGREVEVDEDEVAPAKAPKSAKPAGTKSPARPAAKRAARGGSAVRKIDPPSWQKVFRRAAIFAPVMLVVVYFLKPKDATAASIIVQVVALLIFFIPFSYFMDVMMYRAYRKRIGDPLPPRERKGKPSKPS